VPGLRQSGKRRPGRAGLTPIGHARLRAALWIWWLTGALLDRLTHHVHILEMNGESYRLKTSRRRRHGKPEAAADVGSN
jgi:hypothetical protein